MIIAFNSLIGPVPINCVISEEHQTELGITQNPIESGADVTDHAYVKPKRVVLEIADGNAAATYNALVRFQETRVPFTIVTGLTVYRDMLIAAIKADRDATFSRVLRARVDLQEVVIVNTAYAVSEAGDQSPNESAGGQPGGAKSTQAARPTPEKTTGGVTADRAAGTVQRGDQAAKTINVQAPANRSILSRLTGGSAAPTTPIGRPTGIGGGV